MASKKTAKKTTKKTKGARSKKTTKAVAKKRVTFRTYTSLRRVCAARSNSNLPRGSVVETSGVKTLLDDMEHVKIRIGSAKKGTVYEASLPAFLSEAFKLLGFKESKDEALPAFGTPVVSAN